MGKSIPTSTTMKRPTAPDQPLVRPRKHNAWLDHVKAFREKHPNLRLKQALKQAKETYTPVVKVPRTSVEHPWLKHIADVKAQNPNWRATMTYKQLLVKAKHSYISPHVGKGPVPMERD